MKYLAIRDDGLSFFSQPAEIEALYGSILPRVPVSFGCLSHTAAPKSLALADNRRLVDYLRHLLEKRQCELMVHGHTHEYRHPYGRGQAESLNKSVTQLKEEIAASRDYLANLFGLRPRVFAPRQNTSSRAAAEAAAAAGLDLCAQLSWFPDRPWSYRYIYRYQQCWAYRLAHRRPYPFALDFGTHRELVSYTLADIRDFDHVMSCLRACAEEDAPFVVATHHWQLSEDAGLHSALLRVVDAALDLDYLPATIADAVADRRRAPNIASPPSNTHANSAH